MVLIFDDYEEFDRYLVWSRTLTEKIYALQSAGFTCLGITVPKDEFPQVEYLCALNVTHSVDCKEPTIGVKVE